MRNAFIEELVALAKIKTNIALVVGDLGYSVVEQFAQLFPDRFINAGVAEQNMAGLAAGMASEGYHVFTYSIGNFPTFRCAEQLRNDVDYQKMPVTTVAVGGGLGYGALGYSHHAVQDYALMRILPSTLLATPACPQEVRACLRYLVENPQPSYLRLGKVGEPSLHESTPNVKPGKWLALRTSNSPSSKKIAVLTTGAVGGHARQWVEDSGLEQVPLFSLPLWGLAHKSNQYEQAREFDSVITIEDHLIDGGFGSWFIESLGINREKAPKVCSIGLDPVVCGLVGSQETLNKLGGLTVDRLKYELGRLTRQV